MSSDLGFSEARLELLTQHLQSYIDRGYLAGISALVMRKGQVAYTQSLGQQALGGEKLRADSLFRIYSMTKPVTTVAALLLMEEGRLLLSDPVATYLPYFADTQVCAAQEHKGLRLEPQRRPMTVRDLMTHTSGLSYGWFRDSPVDGLYRASKINPEATPLGEFVEQLATFPLVFQPGTGWRYGFSTDVLAHLVEVVADESLDSFFQSRILEPLGMTDTAFEVPAAKLERLTSVYCPGERFSFARDYAGFPKGEPLHAIDTPERSRFVNPPVLVNGFSGGGGLVSTTGDYARFAQMLLGEGTFEGTRLLGRKTVELMRSNHVPRTIRPLEIGGNPLQGNGFGLGVAVLEDVGASGSPGSAGQFGWSGAAMTNVWLDPHEDTLALLMTQFMPNDFYTLSQSFYTLVYSALE